MGKYMLQRPAWNRRGQKIDYIVEQRILTRGWPKGYRDAKSETQLCQRSKMAQLSAVLAKLQPLLALGYEKGQKPNGRSVGRYHMAMRRGMREWFSHSKKESSLHLQKIQLTDGNAALPAQLKIERANGKIFIQWERMVNKNGITLLFASYEKQNSQWITATHTLGDDSNEAQFSLPAEWNAKTIDVWVAFLSKRGSMKTVTRYQRANPQ